MNPKNATQHNNHCYKYCRSLQKLILFISQKTTSMYVHIRSKTYYLFAVKFILVCGNKNRTLFIYFYMLLIFSYNFRNIFYKFKPKIELGFFLIIPLILIQPKCLNIVIIGKKLPLKLFKQTENQLELKTVRYCI